MDKHLAGGRRKALWGPQLSQSVNLPEGQLLPSHLALPFFLPLKCEWQQRRVIQVAAELLVACARPSASIQVLSASRCRAEGTPDKLQLMLWFAPRGDSVPSEGGHTTFCH